MSQVRCEFLLRFLVENLKPDGLSKKLSTVYSPVRERTGSGELLTVKYLVTI